MQQFDDQSLKTAKYSKNSTLSEIIVTNLAMHGAAIWVSPEIDDGLPPTSSNSIEAFPSAEATNLQRSDIYIS